MQWHNIHKQGRSHPTMSERSIELSLLKIEVPSETLLAPRNSDFQNTLIGIAGVLAWALTNWHHIRWQTKWGMYHKSGSLNSSPICGAPNWQLKRLLGEACSGGKRLSHKTNRNEFAKKTVAKWDAVAGGKNRSKPELESLPELEKIKRSKEGRFIRVCVCVCSKTRKKIPSRTTVQYCHATNS